MTTDWVEGDDGARLRLHHVTRDGAGQRPPLLWGHANGFAAGSYRPFLELLAEHFDVWAWDARGHGESGQPTDPLELGCHGDTYARDLDAVARAVERCVGDDRHLHFAGHSLPGYACVRLGAVFGRAPWASVTLFEPPICPTPEYPEHAQAMTLGLGLIQGAERRRRRWESVEAYRDRLAGRGGSYGAWRADMLAAHAEATLKPAPDGDGMTLRCAPEVEAATYRMTLNTSTFRALPDFPAPVTFVAGGPAAPGGPPSWAALVQPLAANLAPRGRLARIEGASHMMVFERPETCRDVILESVAAAAT